LTILVSYVLNVCYTVIMYGGVSKSFRTGRLERELQMVQLSATGCSCVAILWVSLVSFAAIPFVLLLNECLRWCSQKFTDWPPGARTANGTALWHWVQLCRYFVSQCSEFCSHNPLCCFSTSVYGGVSKSLRTGRLERELQMVQLSATGCSCVAILWVSLVSFAAVTLCVVSQRVFIVVSVYFVIDSVQKLLDTPSYI
jgi:hypothetical protein